MPENNDKSRNGLQDSVGDETIVFRRQNQPEPRQASNDMQNTAKLQGGAVIRPLKSQTAGQGQAQNQKLTPMQEAQRRQQLIRQQQEAAQAKNPTSRQTADGRHTADPRQTATGASAVRPISATQSQNGQAVSRQTPQQRPTPVQQRPASQPQTQQRPLSQGQRSAPEQQRQTPSQAPNAGEIRRAPINVTAKSGANSTPVRPLPTPNSNRTTSSYAKNSLPTASVNSHIRTENDDFEIDEATYSRRARTKKYDSRFADSATSAVMSVVKAMVYIVALIAVSVGISVFIINTANDVFKFVVDEKMVSVTIPEYASIDDVTDALYESGAIKYKWAFKLWSELKDSGAEFIPGTYEVSTALNYDYLRASFKGVVRRTEVRISIPEGFTVDEIIDRFVENGIGTREGFIDVIQNYDFDYRFLEGLEVSPDRIYRLEGYLFPDTYNFYQDSSEVTVIKKLLDNFDRKFASEYYDRCKDLGITVDQAIILASMIEKETRYADELGYVSSVFHNRLKRSSSFPFLNSDATIMYAMQHDLGGRPDGMTGEDTGYDSPYNTYTNKGYPPGPIANPGLNSIKYALYPNESNYYYFVSDSSGRMLFASTEPEHIKNINIARGN